MRTTTLALTALLMSAAPAMAAQTIVTPGPPPAVPAAPMTMIDQQTPPPAQAPRASTPPAAPPATPRPQAASTANVRLEIAISDAAGAQGANKKSVTMLIADNQNGRVRSSNDVRFSQGDGTFRFQTITINIDAFPSIKADGRILLNLSMEYMPDVSVSSQAAQKPASLTESFGVLLTDGKPTIISQSADPQTDRKVTVEVTATIIK